MGFFHFINRDPMFLALLLVLAADPKEPTIRVVESKAVEVGNVPESFKHRTLEQWAESLRVTVAGIKNDSSLLGTHSLVDGTLKFEPRFPFEPGVKYRAIFKNGDAETSHEFTIPKPKTVAGTVAAIFPSADKLPENTLRFYIHFSIDALQLTIEKGKSKQMEKALIQEAHRINTQGRKLITIIDEAHLLDLDVLRKLRLLFDEFPKNHNIILFAQSELLNRLSMRVYEDIKSRITFSAKLYPLNPEQMKEYIYKEIQAAELPANVFDESAIDLIIRTVDGNLRLCRNLCYGSLVETVYLKQKIATIQMVNRVIIQPHWRSHEELITQGA